MVQLDEIEIGYRQCVRTVQSYSAGSRELIQPCFEMHAFSTPHSKPVRKQTNRAEQIIAHMSITSSLPHGSGATSLHHS